MNAFLRTRCCRGLAAKHSPLWSTGRAFSSYDDDEMDDTRRKTALVLGSSGCLGSAVVRHLCGSMKMKVLGADVVSPPEDSNISFDSFIQLPTYSQPASVADVTRALVQGISDALDDDEEIDAIVCACGGWMGDPPPPKPDVTTDLFMKGVEEYGNTINKMLEMNLYPILAAGYAANRFMANEGTIFLELISIYHLEGLWHVFSPLFCLYDLSTRSICCHRSHARAFCDTWNACVWLEQSWSAPFCSDARGNNG